MSGLKTFVFRHTPLMYVKHQLLVWCTANIVMVAGQNWKGGARKVLIICCEKETAEFKMSFLTVCKMPFQLEIIKNT